MPYRPIDDGRSTTYASAYHRCLTALLLAFALGLVVAPRARAQEATPPATSEADVETALGLFHQGEAEYREGRFEEASALFVRAHALYPEPVLLYNLARSEENLRHFRVAADTYRAYLDADANADDRAGIERRIATLEAAADTERAEAEAEAAEAAEAEAVVPAPEARDDVPWAPIAIGGVGVLGLGAGIGVAIAAQDQWTLGRGEPIQQRAVALDASARDLATVANVMFAVAGAVVAIAAVWLIVELTD